MVYIYIWYPPLRSTSEHFDIFSLHVYNIYIYICAYTYKSQLFFLRCLVGSSCAHYQNKLETKNNNYLTTLLERIHAENPRKQKTSRKPTKNNIWRLFGKALLTKSKKPRENQKNKKQFFSENVWSEAHVWFFLVLPRFFWFFFGFDLEKTKKNSMFFIFLDKMMVKEL